MGCCSNPKRERGGRMCPLSSLAKMGSSKKKKILILASAQFLYNLYNQLFLCKCVVSYTSLKQAKIYKYLATNEGV